MYTSANIVIVIKSVGVRWARNTTHARYGRNAYRVVIKTSEGKKPLLTLRLRWEDNI